MSEPTRIIFMGTPDFAVPSLRALHEARDKHNWQVVAVVTQPDRPAGRGRKVVLSPVKAYAVTQGFPVLQPASLRKEPEMAAALRDLQPDLLIVAAFGQILRQEVLDLPRRGAINVHASILPAYRGASPITAALLAGDTETGNSIMLMDAGMDTGPVLSQEPMAILPDDTTASLSSRLADAGGATVGCNVASLVDQCNHADPPGCIAGRSFLVPDDQERSRTDRLERVSATD